MKKGNGIILLAIALTVLFYSCKKETPENIPGEKPVFNFKIQFLSGEVTIISASVEKKAAVADMVAINDTIITGKKSFADLTYGSSGIIRISENSHLSIAALAGDASSESMINLDRGKVLLTLGKLQNTGFKVKTPTVVASVRGTSFVVSADVVRGARLSVMKGTVTVAPISKGEAIEGKAISIGAGQKMDYLSSRTVDQVLQGRATIPVIPMTEAEIIEIKEETAGIKVDVIKELDEEIKQEVRKDVIEADPKILMQQAAGKNAVETQDVSKKPGPSKETKEISSKLDENNLAEEQRRLEEERKIEELRKKAEEEEARARAKKEKASNIPTL